MNEIELERFKRKVKVDEESGCWLWQGALSPKGYGTLGYRGKMVRAHRLAYEHYVGTIAKRMQIDHTCSIKHCVYHEHLEQVTNCENNVRAVERKENYNSAKTHCKHGHEFSVENTQYSKHRVTGVISRDCRTCNKLYREARKVDAKGHFNSAKTHCPNGHEYTEENTYTNKAKTQRSCRTCKRLSYERKKLVT